MLLQDYIPSAQLPLLFPTVRQESSNFLRILTYQSSRPFLCSFLSQKHHAAEKCRKNLCSEAGPKPEQRFFGRGRAVIYLGAHRHKRLVFLERRAKGEGWSQIPSLLGNFYFLQGLRQTWIQKFSRKSAQAMANVSYTDERPWVESIPGFTEITLSKINLSQWFSYYRVSRPR